MFSKKTVIIVSIIFLFTATIIILTVNSRQRRPASDYELERIGIAIVAPFQKGVTQFIKFTRNLWSQYFSIVNTARENMNLRLAIREEISKNNLYKETEIANIRLRRLLNFQKSISRPVLAAEVVGRDPSPWFKTIIIDKGGKDGLRRGLPVVIAEGIIGQTIKISPLYSRVLLIIDQNSAVDALVQETRARGIIQGGPSGNDCILKFVLRKERVKLGDAIISSGLDGVYPKGLRIGEVSKVIKQKAGIFQQVTVSPYVDFEKLEEVLVILTLPLPDF